MSSRLIARMENLTLRAVWRITPKSVKGMVYQAHRANVAKKHSI
jgi:hypothetical protein